MTRIPAWEEAGDEELRRRGIDPRNVRLIRAVQSPAGIHMDYQQVHNGLPVFGAGATLHFDAREQLLAADIDFRTDIPPALGAAPPRISADQAEGVAVSHLGGVEVLRGDPTKELGILPLLDGGYALVWRVLCPAYQPAGDWLFQIDAATGAILTRENVMVEVQTRVFHPNPIVTSGNVQLFDLVTAGDNYEVLLNQTVEVDLLGLEPARGGVVLAGELVRIINANPPRTDPIVGDDLVFEPGTPQFAGVMTYYWLDTMVRYLRRLGFPDLLRDGMEADSQDNTARGGAFYSPWDRRLGFAPAVSGLPAMAEDAKVILHELGHAIQHDQVRDWGSHREARAMGEGFGDALAAIYFAHVNNGFNRAVVGDWVRPPRGLRRVDTDLRYPADMVGEEHHDGQIWSRVLWDIYRAVGGDSPQEDVRLQARDAALRLIIQSHYFLRSGARFADGARALLLADQALYQGRVAPVIRQALAERGIPTAEERSSQPGLTPAEWNGWLRVVLLAAQGRFIES